MNPRIAAIATLSLLLTVPLAPMASAQPPTIVHLCTDQTSDYCPGLVCFSISLQVTNCVPDVVSPLTQISVCREHETGCPPGQYACVTDGAAQQCVVDPCLLAPEMCNPLQTGPGPCLDSLNGGCGPCPPGTLMVCSCLLCEITPIIACNTLPTETVGYFAGFQGTSCIGGRAYVCTDPQVTLPSRFLPGHVQCTAEDDSVLVIP